MANVNLSAFVNHSARDMYKLVNDVASYPEFLPWCTEAKVLEKGGGSMVASLVVEKGHIRHAFTTSNRYTKNKEIKVDLVDGPFKHLQGVWKFTQFDDGTSKVDMDLDFEFHGRLGDFALRGILKKAANIMVDAFCTRANELYG